MRKLLYTFAGLTALAMIASCNKEAEQRVSTDGPLTATFTVTAPGAVATKAISDGASATDFAFAAYDESGNYLSDLSDYGNAHITGTSSPWTVTIPVVKDMTYQFVFLAKSASDNDFCTFTPASHALTLDYTTLNANDDNADFFYVKDQITVGDSFTKTETMTRPLAQVNVGASDLTEAAYSIKTDATMLTGLSLTGIYNAMDVLDGTLTGAADIELVKASRVSETSQFVTGYDRIAMVYVLAGASQTSNATINVSAQGAQNTTAHTITRSVPNIPLQANYRTNILGNIFTNDFTFTVQTEAGFTGDIKHSTTSTVTTLNTSLATNVGVAQGQSYTVEEVQAENNIIVIPTGTAATSLFFSVESVASGVTEITVQDENASSSTYGKEITLEVPTGITVNIQTTGAHVVLKQGTNITVFSATSSTTLEVASGVSVSTLTVNQGHVFIKKGGTVSNIVRGESNPDDVTYVQMAEGAAWTNLSTTNPKIVPAYPREGLVFNVSDASYHIENQSGLENMRSLINGGTTTFSGATVILDTDINLSGVTNWTPIGVESYQNNFRGIFDGNGHVIRGLNINHASTAGLFGTLNFGTIKNLTVSDFSITGNHYAGGIVAWVEQGASDVLVQNCTVKDGSILSVPEKVGSSYDNGDKAGGIVGFAYKGSYLDNTVKNVSITAYRDLGGVAGYINAATVTGNTVKDSQVIQRLANGYKQISDIVDLKGEFVGRLAGEYTLNNNTADNVTVSTVFAEGIEVGNDGAYHIVSKKGLETFRDLVNAGSPFSGLTFKLDVDINLAGESWTPIGHDGDAANKFAGIFDGDGKTIKNLSIDLTATPAYQAAGLFGAITGTVKNLSFQGATVKNLTTGSSTDNGTAVVVGSLMNGTIENVTVMDATVEGNRYVGGVSGYVSGVISGCSVDGLSITATPDNLSGSFDNGDKVGGIYGYLNTASGGVSNQILNNSVKDFTIRGYRDMGGIGGTALVAATLSGNKAENGTIIIDQVTNSYGTIATNTNEIFGRTNSSPSFEDNSFSEVTVCQYLADGVMRQGTVVTVTSAATGNLKAATEGAVNGDTIKIAAGLEFDVKADWGGYTSMQPVPFCQNKTLTIEGGEGTTLDFGHGNYAGTYEPVPPANGNGAHLSFKNIHLVNSTTRSDGSGAAPEGCALIRDAAELNFEGCTFSGVLVTVNNPVVNLTSCVFNETEHCKYTFWIHSKAEVTAQNCTFKTGKTDTGKTDGWIKIYADGSQNDGNMITLSLNGCAFAGNSDEETHNIKVDAKNQYVITATGCTSDYATTSNGKFIQVKNHAITFNGTSMDAGTQASLPE